MVLIHYSKENPEIFEQEASQSRLTRKRRYGSKEDDVFHLIKDCENCKVSQERKDIIKRIEELIKSKDFNINHQDGDGDTFLHAAIIANLPDVANLFLAKGINVALSNKEDKTPYQLAKEKFHTDPQWSTVIETLKKLSEADQSKDPLSPDGQQVLENNNLNLPEGFQVGKAIGEGDCFFDTVTQGLRQLKPEKEFSVKSLRKVCKEFAQSQLSIDESWLKGNLEGENEKLNEYIPCVEFTADDIKQKLEKVSLLGLTSAIWGRPEIEGRIICAKYNVKIYVIEKQVVEGETIWINQLVDSKGSKSVEDIDYNKENAIYIVNQGRLHFEPVLRKQLSFIAIPKPGSNDISQPKPTATNRVVKWLGKEGEYTEEQIRENPNLLFLFGDNDKAKYRTNKNNPVGDGQASVIRPTGEGKSPYDRLPEYRGLNGNGIGITTTFYDGYVPNIDEFKALMDREFAPIETWVKKGGSVVIPCNDQGKHNLGTGIAKLEEKIPGAIEYIQPKIDDLVELGKQPVQNPQSLDTLKQELHKTLLVERESYKSHEGLKSYIRELDQQPQRKKARIDSESEESMPELSAGQGSITNDRDNMEVDSEKQTRKRPLTDGQLENRDLKRQKLVQPSWRSNPTHTAGELKRSLHGNNYQLELLILFAWRYKGYVAFRLGTEVAEAGKFDDLVLRYGDDQDRTYRFLQAKHTQHLTEKSNIQYEEFFEADGDFSLKKYFLSYLKKNEEKFQDGLIRDVILCTNRNLKENIKDYFEEITAQDEVLDLGGKRYRFSKDQAKRNDVIQKLSRVLNKNTRSGALTKHTDKTISEFLDQLVLAVGQLSGPDLSNIIKTEIGDVFNLTPVNNVIYNAFYKYMSEWMEHRVKDGAGPGSAHFMEHDDLKGFVNDAKIKIAEIVSIGPTSVRRREIKELNIAFEGGTTLNELRDFLTSGDEKQIFNLATKNTLLSAVKVDSVLRSMSLYNKEDSHIFLRLSTLLILQERFIKAFTSPTNNLLVIECDPISGDREGLYDKLSKIVRGESNKKVILITKEGNDLANKFKQEFSQLDKYEEKRDDENGFKNLNAGSQQKLLSKNVIFQGKDKRLGELLDSESLKKVVGPNELVELITSDEIKIGGEVDEFSYVPNENLGRELKLNKVSVKVLGEDGGAFILECKEAKEDLESLQGELRTEYVNKQIFVLDTSSAKKKFQELADEKDSGNIYLLKGQFSELKESKDAKLELKESHGVLNKLRNHIVVDMDGVDNLSEVFVIHGETGIGKTVFLNELCHKHSQSSWVIYVDLFHSSHGIWFSKDFSGDANINSFIKVLKELKKLNSKFEESLFGLALKGEGIKLTIFFDSFDLLGADSQKAILSLLKTLKGHTGLERLGIAVRSYDKHKVEDDLSLLAYELPRLERADQDTVLNHFIELYGKESEGNSIRESVDRYRRQGGDTSLPITLEILPNIPMPNSDESLDTAQLCQKQLEGLLLKFANSGGVQSGVSEKLKAHILSLALSQSFGEARASVDKEFIGFAGRYVGIGGIFDSSRDTNSPALRSFFAEFLSRKHPAIQSIINKRKRDGFSLNDIDKAGDIVKEKYYTDVARPLRKYVDWQSVKDRGNPIYKDMMDIIENKRQVHEFKVILECLKSEDKYYEFIKEKGVLPFTSNHEYNSYGLVRYLINEILSEGLEELDRSNNNSEGEWFGKYFSFIDLTKDSISRDKSEYYRYLSFRMPYIRERSEFKDALIYFAKLGNIQVVNQLFSTRLWIYYASSSGSPQILLTPENLSTGSGILLVEKDGSLINDVIQNIEQRDNLLSISVEKKLYHLSVAAMRTDSGKQEIADDKGGKILYQTIYHEMVIVRDELSKAYSVYKNILNALGSDGKAFIHRFLECHYRGKIKTYLQKVEHYDGDIDISVLDSSGRTIELIAASGKGYQNAFFAILKAFPKQRPKLLESSLTAVEKIKGTQNKLTAFENLLKFRRTTLEKPRPQKEEEPYVNDNNLRIIQKIAELYKEDKNYEKALEWFQELHEMKERSLGSKHKQVLWIGLEIVSILRKQEKYDEALEHLEGLLNLRRGELNIDENDYFFNSILVSAEYEKAMIELLQGSYLIVFDKLEEVLNGLITQLDDGEALYVLQREQLSELLDKLETLEQQGYSVDNLKGLYEEIFKRDENLKEFLGRSKCEKRKAKDKRDVSKMLCVDSRDEEDITKEEKERRIKELVGDEMLMRVKLREEILSRHKEIKRGATANKNDLLSNAWQSLKRSKTLLLMDKKNEASTELLKEACRNLVNDLGALIHDHKNHVHGDHLNALESRVRSNQLFSVAHDLYYLLKSEGNVDKGKLYSDQIKNKIDSYNYVEGKNNLDAILSDVDIKDLFRDRDVKDFYTEGEAYDKEVITIHAAQVFADEVEVYVKVKDGNGDHRKFVIGNIASIQDTENYILDEETSEIKLRVNDDKEYIITQELEEEHVKHYLNIPGGHKVKIGNIISSFTGNIKEAIHSKLDGLELLASKKDVEEISNAEITDQGYNNVISEVRQSLLQKGVSEGTFNQLKDHLDNPGEKVFAEYISDIEKKLEGHGIKFDHNKFDSAKVNGAKGGKFFFLMAIYDLFDSINDVPTLGRYDNDALKKIFGINGILDAMDDVRESLSVSYTRSDGKVITKISRDSAMGKVVSKIPDHVRKTFVKIINNPVVQSITFATIAYQFGCSINEIAKGNHHPLNYYWTASSGIKLASMSIKPISTGVSSAMKGISATTKVLRGLSTASKVLGKAAMVTDVLITIGIEIHERMEYTKAIGEQVPLLPGNEQAEVFFAKVIKAFTGRDIEKEYEDIIRIKGYLDQKKEEAIELLSGRHDVAVVVQYIPPIEEKYSEIIKEGPASESSDAGVSYGVGTVRRLPECKLEKKLDNVSFGKIYKSSNLENNLSLLNLSNTLPMTLHTLVMYETLGRVICFIKDDSQCSQERDKKRVYIFDEDLKYAPHLTIDEYNLGFRITSVPSYTPQKSRCSDIINKKHNDMRNCNEGKVHRTCQETYTFSGPLILTNSTRNSSSGTVLYISGLRELTAAANYPAEIHVPEGHVNYTGSQNNKTIFIINEFDPPTWGNLKGAVGKENIVLMNVKADDDMLVDLHHGSINYLYFGGSHNYSYQVIQLSNIYNYVSSSSSEHNVTTHCKTRLINAKNAKVGQSNQTCQDEDYEVIAVNEGNLHYRGLKQTFFVISESSNGAIIYSNHLESKKNLDIICMNNIYIAQLKINEHQASYSLELLTDDKRSTVTSTKIDSFENLVIQIEHYGITIIVQNKSLPDVIKDIEYQKLNHSGIDVDSKVMENSKKRSKAVILANITGSEDLAAYEVAKSIINDNNLGIPISLVQARKIVDNTPHEAVVENMYPSKIVADFSCENINCRKVITVEMKTQGSECVVKFPQPRENDNPVDLELRVITPPYASASDRMVDLTECGISPEDVEVKGSTTGIILNSYVNQGSFQVVLDNYLRGLEYQHIAFQFNKGGEIYKVNSTNLQLEPVLYNYEKKKWVDYDAFKYYEPGEQGLQIYHNQPNDENKVGFIALKDRSVSDFVMKIVYGDLILSSGNNTVVEVENWSTYRPARKMIFAFNDTVVASPRCTASLACHPEGIIEKFKREKEKKEKPVQRKRRHQPRHHSREQRYLHGEEHLESRGTSRSIENDNYVIRNNKATSGASKPSSWINDLFGWVKDSVGGLFGSKVTLPGKPGNSTVQSLPNISQHNETAKGSSPSSFLSVENVALIGCIAEALDNTLSKRYQALKSQGVNFIPSTQTAVNFARRKFDSFVEDKIRNLDSKEKARIRTEVKNAYPEIIESFRRGVEFSGNIGLDDVLEKCKRCFCTNMLPNNVSQSESQMLGKTDDKPETRLSDVTVNNQQITGHTK